jgi:hypothetical protein
VILTNATTTKECALDHAKDSKDIRFSIHSFVVLPINTIYILPLIRDDNNSEYDSTPNSTGILITREYEEASIKQGGRKANLMVEAWQFR